MTSVEDVISICRTIEAPGLRTFASADPLAFKAASGWTVTGTDGTEYLELGGMNGVANVGHAHPKVVEAIRRQAGELIHCPSGHPSPARASFYSALAAILPEQLNAVFPNLTGAAANETALLLARARRPQGQFICFSGGYHGRSIGTVGIAGKTQYRESLGLPPTAQFVPFPDPTRDGPDCVANTMRFLATLTSAAGGAENVAAVIVEPVEGNCGVIVPPRGFLKQLRAFCDDTGSLLVCDEIQSGAGRTGKLWAFQHEDIVPDIVTAGKGLGGGMPVSITATRRELVDWAPDSVAGTFIVNNVGLAAAEAAIQVLIEENLAERSCRLGSAALQRLQEGLKGCAGVRIVRGVGLWLAIELRERADEKASVVAGRIIRRLRSQHIIVAGGGYNGEVVKIAPPLNIDQDALNFGLDSMIEAVKSETLQAERT